MTHKNEANKDGNAFLKVLRPAEVDNRCGLSKSVRYDLEARGLFPKRLKLSERASGYFEHEINEWLQSRPRVRSVLEN